MKVRKEVIKLVEFDRTVVQRMTVSDGSISYVNASNDETSGFSPVVAVLTLGLSERHDATDFPTAGRTMFTKTMAGNTVTHKVALYSDSLCILMGGRTESR